MSQQAIAEKWRRMAAKNATAYEKGVQRALTNLKYAKLPPRGPRGDPRNIERVNRVVEALSAARRFPDRLPAVSFWRRVLGWVRFQWFSLLRLRRHTCEWSADAAYCLKCGMRS